MCPRRPQCNSVGTSKGIGRGTQCKHDTRRKTSSLTGNSDRSRPTDYTKVRAADPGSPGLNSRGQAEEELVLTRITAHRDSSNNGVLIRFSNRWRPNRPSSLCTDILMEKYLPCRRISTRRYGPSMEHPSWICTVWTCKRHSHSEQRI